MKWIGKHIFDKESVFRDHIKVFQPINDANLTISIGKDDNDRAEITGEFHSGAQTFNRLRFRTFSSSGATNAGRILFQCDETSIGEFRDGGFNLQPSMNLSIGGTDILADSSGTTTLSNIDAVDNTTRDAVSNAIVALGSNKRIEMGGTQSIDPTETGHMLAIRTGTLTDETTSGGSTLASSSSVNITGPTLSSGEAITITDAATVHIASAPTAGDNTTLTRAHALWVDAGNVKFDETLTVNGTITGNVTGNLTGQADTVATIAGLAPNTATTQGTQPNITSCANLATVGTIGTGVWQGTAIASAYLDADTAHYSATRQLTHHGISDDIDSDVVYISLLESDAENTSAGNKHLPIIAPAAGKLLKIFVRTTVDQSSETFTWKLYTRSTSNSTNGAASEIGAQSGAGPTNKTMVTYDFTTGLDSGTNAINAGDKVLISLEAGDGATANGGYFITCLWEWDLS